MIKLVETDHDWHVLQQLQAILFPGNFDSLYYKKWRKLPTFRGILLYADDQPIGCGTFVLHSNVIIHSIGVLAMHRRRGLGVQLWEAIKTHCVEAGAKSFELHVSVSNHVAIAFYQNIGFQVVETVRAYYHSRVLRGDALRMQLAMHA